MPTAPSAHDRTDACSQCAADPGRRAFLRHAVAAGAAALASLGLSPRDAAALGIGVLRGRKGAGGQVSYPVPPDDGVHVDRQHEVLLVRHAGMAYAFALSCPHQRTMLKWLEREGRFQCPKHKSKYRPDGTFMSGRATRNMDRHGIALRGGELVVDVDVVFRSDKERDTWEGACVKLGG